MACFFCKFFASVYNCITDFYQKNHCCLICLMKSYLKYLYLLWVVDNMEYPTSILSITSDSQRGDLWVQCLMGSMWAHNECFKILLVGTLSLACQIWIISKLFLKITNYLLEKLFWLKIRRNAGLKFEYVGLIPERQPSAADYERVFQWIVNACGILLQNDVLLDQECPTSNSLPRATRGSRQLLMWLILSLVWNP